MGDTNTFIPEGIYALAKPSSGITALNLNGECNLFGKKTYFNMISFETFAIIDDAPVEKEVVKEKEGSWWGNLITGVVATVALAACAVAVVATGGAALGAIMLAGAAVGAGIVTASVAITDAKSGQARSWTQFLGDLVNGIGMGAVAGATIYGLWVALPIVGQATGIQVSMWLGGVSKFTAIIVPKIVTGVGYSLMGLQGARYLNEITSIGTGQNWILENIFGGNQDNYTTASMCLDLLSMGYLQIAADNAGLAQNKPKKEKKSSDGSPRSGYDFDGNEVPYVSDYFDIEDIEKIEDSRMFGESRFYEVNVNGKKIYVSTGLIKQSQFGNIVDKVEGKVSILSGVHGDVSGNILLECNGIKGDVLLNEDIARWGNANNVTIYNVSELSAMEVSSIINSSDHTFFGWCFSERSKLVLEALGIK